MADTLDVARHGTWVRSLRTDDFGRICYMVYDRLHPGSVEAMCQWEPESTNDKRGASYHLAEELMVRPYKPRPWYNQDRIPTGVYYGDSVTTAG